MNQDADIRDHEQALGIETSPDIEADPPGTIYNVWVELERMEPGGEGETIDSPGAAVACFYDAEEAYAFCGKLQEIGESMSEGHDPEGAQRLRDLEEIAAHAARLLNMSDVDHPDFRDSGADVVDELWSQHELIRRVQGQPANG